MGACNHQRRCFNHLQSMFSFTSGHVSCILNSNHKLHVCFWPKCVLLFCCIHVCFRLVAGGAGQPVAVLEQRCSCEAAAAFAARSTQRADAKGGRMCRLQARLPIPYDDDFVYDYEHLLVFCARLNVHSLGSNVS